LKSNFKSPKNHSISLIKNITRDKSDTLLLILACLSIVLMHFSAIAWWISAASICLMLWRSWITFSGHRLPPRWLLLPLSIALMALVFTQFRTFLGREAGIAMLIILLSLKMLEMHAKRDLFVVVFLGLFLRTTSFFYSQSLGSAFLVLIVVSLLLCAQLSFQYTKKSPSLWLRLKLIFKMFALAIPLTIFCFVFFPRIQGPFWNMPKDANSARSGLSDTMSPGNISRLAMSEELVFRVKFLGAPLEKSSLYWRAIVLNQFNGRTWSRQKNQHPTLENETKQIAQTAQTAQAIKQRIILEPSESTILYALDIVQRSPALDEIAVNVNQDGELRASQILNKRIRYDVISNPNFSLQGSTNSLDSSLQLPRNFNPRTIEFANTILENYPDKKEQIDAVLRFFRNETFFYTLEPPLLGRDSIDDFIFNTKQGFCEHYASAFVVLMRAMNIPARVVTGYQGGNINLVDGYLEVRQSDAHAWAEVWFDNKGWIRIDPTAAVAPDRIIKGLNATQKQQGFSALMQSVLGKNSILSNLKMRWSAVNNSWNQWVLSYSQLKQMNLLESLGLAKLDWSQIIGLIFLSGSILIALMALPLLRHRTKQTPVDQLYLKLITKISKKLPGKLPSEGPKSYLQRIKNSMSLQQYEITEKFILQYIAFQYGKHPQNEKSVIQQLKALLKLIR
jgi:hypothetical protein